jgi:flagellar basal body-associated protein FliL
MKKTLLAILIGLALMVLFYALGALFSGGGHDLTAMIAFFPYSLSLGLSTKDTPWSSDFVDMALLILQFPVYAIILATIKSGRLKVIALVILLVLHVAAVIICLRIYYLSRPARFGVSQQHVEPERWERFS